MNSHIYNRVVGGRINSRLWVAPLKFDTILHARESLRLGWRGSEVTGRKWANPFFMVLLSFLTSPTADQD